MGKALYIAEKASVARSFAEVIDDKFVKRDGYQEGEKAVVTWCVGHLVTMSYPEVYDEKYRKWRMETLPFLPQEFLYEVIPGVKKQFNIVSELLNRADIDVIYVCTDSGREGEYIYRLVSRLSGVRGKSEKRVWINSQTRDEILRGIKEAKDIREYDNLSDSAYLRAKEDYLMGINFSRILSIKYGRNLANMLNKKYCVISVGRVMTCVLGMVVRREREIRDFVKKPFYRILMDGNTDKGGISMEWKAMEGSKYYGSPILYSETGFLKEENARALILEQDQFCEATVISTERKKEKKNPPLLYNLAELQNDAAKLFKISPEETLNAVQELYEKRLVTYPRTDARVLSSAVAKEIDKNLKGLGKIAEDILTEGRHKNIIKSRFVDDKKITDHYAIIPTGVGASGVKNLNPLLRNIYEVITRRFIAIFYDPAIYEKVSVVARCGNEFYVASAKALKEEGYLKVMNYSFLKKEESKKKEERVVPEGIRKNDIIRVEKRYIKEGEATPPKRYISGSMILAMENAGQLIEDEELREQIKGSGIGTAATRAGIIEKLVKNGYISINKKTQILKPTIMGEMIYEVVFNSIRPLLNPELTASWEKGLSLVANGEISTDEYMVKLENFIKKHTINVKQNETGNILNKNLINVQNSYAKEKNNG